MQLSVQIDLARALTPTEPLEPLDFIWPGFLAGTVGALVSLDDTARFVFALEAAIAVAGGRDFLGLQPACAGRVVFLTEEHSAVLVHRLHAIGKYLSRDEREAVSERLLVESVVGERLDLMHEAHLRAITRAATGARLIVLDVGSVLYPANELQLLRNLECIATETGAGVLVLHRMLDARIVDHAKWRGHLGDRRMTPPAGKLGGKKGKGVYLRYSVINSYDEPRPDRWLRYDEGDVLVEAPVE